MAKKILKVGFDLDGVILYNPVRVFRPITSFFKFLKPIIFNSRSDKFYFPKSFLEKWLWRLLHKTSFRPNFYLEEIIKLIEEGKIEAYIITARYSFLKKDFENWLKIMKTKHFFTQCHHNKDDEQPNEFKEKMIKELKLDVFVEDNWGLVQRFNKKLKKTKILWITNLLDQFIDYQYKFNNLKEIADYLRKLN